MFPNWSWTLLAISASFHGVAILSTVFRLWYRWYTTRLWWDDAWTALAFSADIASLAAALIERPIPGSRLPRFFAVGNWIVSFSYPILMWAARISILTSIMRVSRPEGTLRRVALGIGTLFGAMGIVMIGLRTKGCITNHCLLTRQLFITQTIMDSVADVLLSGIPIWFLRHVKLSRKRRILICSAFSASMVINIVTVIEVVEVFQSITSGSIVLEHVKLACSMMVCNLLVIVTFVYRILHRGEANVEDSTPDSSRIEFTTVDFPQVGFSQETSKGTWLSAPSRSTEPSTWSFRGDSRSKTSGSAIATVPRIDSPEMMSGEDEYYDQAGL